jgi:serine/threonine protein kinase
MSDDFSIQELKDNGGRHRYSSPFDDFSSEEDVDVRRKSLFEFSSFRPLQANYSTNSFADSISSLKMDSNSNGGQISPVPKVDICRSVSFDSSLSKHGTTWLMVADQDWSACYRNSREETKLAMSNLLAQIHGFLKTARLLRTSPEAQQMDSLPEGSGLLLWKEAKELSLSESESFSTNLALLETLENCCNLFYWSDFLTLRTRWLETIEPELSRICQEWKDASPKLYGKSFLLRFQMITAHFARIVATEKSVNAVTAPLPGPACGRFKLVPRARGQLVASTKEKKEIEGIILSGARYGSEKKRTMSDPSLRISQEELELVIARHLNMRRDVAAVSEDSCTRDVPSFPRLSIDIEDRRGLETVVTGTEPLEGCRPCLPDLTNCEAHFDLVCRICEQPVNSASVEEHSRVCAAVHNTETALKQVESKLRSLIHACDRELAIQKTSKSKEKAKLGLSQDVIRASRSALESNPADINLVISTCEFAMKLLQEKLQASAGKQRLHRTGSVVEGIEQRKRNIKRRAQMSPFLYSSLFDAVQEKKKIFEEVRSGAPLTDVDVHSDDFAVIKEVSSGAYGTVFLVRHKKTQEIYAMKVMRVADVMKKNSVHRVMSERAVLMSGISPFVANLYYSFRSNDNLYMVMEFVPGGDLESLLQKLGRLDEEAVKHYAAELIIAVQDVHSRGIVHRDLKPGNIALDRNGHLRLLDFGLSRVGFGQRSSIPETAPMSPHDYVDLASKSPFASNPPKSFMDCFFGAPLDRRNNSNSPVVPLHRVAGTPDYMAPELILGKDHDKAVDWWAVGIIVYEMLFGEPPYTDDSPNQIFANILSGDLQFPLDSVSPSACNLVQAFLSNDPGERLTGEEAMSHPFFHDIDWKHIFELPAPIQPQLESETDTSYFSKKVSTPAYSTDRDIQLQSVEWLNCSLTSCNTQSIIPSISQSQPRSSGILKDYSPDFDFQVPVDDSADDLRLRDSDDELGSPKQRSWLTSETSKFEEELKSFKSYRNVELLGSRTNIAFNEEKRRNSTPRNLMVKPFSSLLDDAPGSGGRKVSISESSSSSLSITRGDRISSIASSNSTGGEKASAVDPALRSRVSSVEQPPKG